MHLPPKPHQECALMLEALKSLQRKDTTEANLFQGKQTAPDAHPNTHIFKASSLRHTV